MNEALYLYYVISLIVYCIVCGLIMKYINESKGYPDLVPYWCLPNPEENPVRIERIVPMYPFSQDRIRYERIKKILNLYRLTLGQPRQEELISVFDKELLDGQQEELYMNLSPYYHQK